MTWAAWFLFIAMVPVQIRLKMKLTFSYYSVSSIFPVLENYENNKQEVRFRDLDGHRFAIFAGHSRILKKSGTRSEKRILWGEKKPRRLCRL